MEQTVIIPKANGRKLVGVVHEPEPGVKLRDVGLLILNPGIKYRVAPHRWNVKLARHLCRLGFVVLRFDPEGIGDSEGELPGGMSLSDIWGLIQGGHFLSDVQAANDFIAQHHGFKQLILIGNCGGAITALLSGAEDHRVRGLCLVDVPVYLWSSKLSFADTAVAGGARAEKMFAGYIRSSLSPGAWFRFLTFRSEYAALFKVLRTKVYSLMRPFGSQNARVPIEALCQQHRLNPAFFRSFERFRNRGGTMLFISAGNDPGFDTFQEFVVKRYADCLGGNDPRIEARIVKNANHVYSLTEWQDELRSMILSWVMAVGTALGEAAGTRDE